MSALVVVCPLTCKVIPTGIETEPEVLKALPRIPAAVRCPACGEQHFWTCDDAMLLDRIATPAPAGTRDNESERRAATITELGLRQPC